MSTPINAVELSLSSKSPAMAGAEPARRHAKGEHQRENSQKQPVAPATHAAGRERATGSMPPLIADADASRRLRIVDIYDTLHLVESGARRSVSAYAPEIEAAPSAPGKSFRADAPHAAAPHHAAAVQASAAMTSAARKTKKR